MIRNTGRDGAVRQTIIPTWEEQQEYLAYKCEQDVIYNLANGLKELSQLKQKYLPLLRGKGKSNCVLVCGGMAAFDRGLLDFINCWGKAKPGLFLLSEVTAEYRRYTESKMEIPFICTPHLLSKEMIVQGMEITIAPEAQKAVKSKIYLEEAVMNLEARHRNLGKGYAVMWSHYAYLYINKLLDQLMPAKVILWNEFYAFHHIFGGICKERNVPLGFMEFGCIPGTLCVEECGQQGESLPARYPEKFMKQRVSAREKWRAGRVWKYLKRCGLNRNPQITQGIEWEQMCTYRPGRSTIAFIGQNDFESGLFPYTTTTAWYHSPIFHSSLETLEYLSLVAHKNNWNLLFKPHPSMVALGYTDIGENIKDIVTLVEGGSINEVIDASDLIVTLMSQSAYIALIREKPVVMLGYSQLKGKNCTYEAFDKTLIEECIKEALQNHFTISQKKSFRIHIAQLIKYYLLDDMTERKMRFGIKVEHFLFPVDAY